MRRSVDQRPKFARWHRCARIAAKKPGANLEKDTPTEPKTLGLGFAPWEWFKLGKPRVLELRQLAPGYTSGQKLTCNGLEAWLGRCRRTGA